MIDAQTLACKKREIKSRGYLRKAAGEGWIPGIVYGAGRDNMPVFVGKRQLKTVFGKHGSRGLFSLEIEGNETLLALIREVQKNPLSGEVMHLDFMTVNLTEKITSTVGVIIIGEEEVMKQQGIIQSGIKEIEVSCLPQDLPGSITCSVAELSIGDKITVADLQVPEGVEIITDENDLVAVILAPSKAVEEPEEEADEEGAQETTPEEGAE
ncbi:MAG: 50S ribosomal protein L25 [Syntrophomonadaceae bacterium]|jgi:large subunit ribosomal protein L25